jgi:hypothetical protein
MDEESLETVKDCLKDAFSDYYELAGGKEFRYHHHISVHRYASELMNRPEIRIKILTGKLLNWLLCSMTWGVLRTLRMAG